ncbi:hypothetical protein WJX77_002863 [Trebouxia sp. C0004]
MTCICKPAEHSILEMYNCSPDGQGKFYCWRHLFNKIAGIKDSKKPLQQPERGPGDAVPATSSSSGGKGTPQLKLCFVTVVQVHRAMLLIPVQDSPVNIAQKFSKPLEQVAQSSGGLASCHTLVHMAHFVCIQSTVGAVSRLMSNGLKVTARLLGMEPNTMTMRSLESSMSSPVKLRTSS